MKELIMKKISDSEDICRVTHIEPIVNIASGKSIVMIDSGLGDPCEILTNIGRTNKKAKDEASSRKEIIDRIEQWLSACEKENWFEYYNLARLVSELNDSKLTRQQKEEAQKQ
ncbi:hypothetical protein POM88_015320 [Heracleum sosnowskyi]|uniref:Uncharacterized protein n=1 Tax=Heracleum sosnowskyi TaxID=360622 RepID=A0AAD8IJY6_9APIA|nr:hypothetical protein POM88_015320 [Heracleum sosnowskyi]